MHINDKPLDVIAHNKLIKELILVETSLLNILIGDLTYNYVYNIPFNNRRNRIPDLPDGNEDETCSECLDEMLKHNDEMMKTLQFTHDSAISSTKLSFFDLDCYPQKFCSMINAMSKYDLYILSKPYISCTSLIMNALENLDQDAIHKIILRGIKNKEIIYMKHIIKTPYVNIGFTFRFTDNELRIGIQGRNNRRGFPYTNFLYYLMESDSAIDAIKLLIGYVLGKIVNISKIYKLSPIVCPDKINENYMISCQNGDITKYYKDFINMLKHEWLFIKKYFKYGELDHNHREAILFMM